MDDATARWIVGFLRSEFHDLHEKLREQVRGLDPGTLNWRPLPNANSIAVLITHTIGSEREMVRSVRQDPPQRDRDAEFKVEMQAEELLSLIDDADRDLEEYLGSATASDLSDPRPRGDRPPRPGLEWLVTNYGHAREHLAQLELTKQLYDSRT